MEDYFTILPNNLFYTNNDTESLYKQIKNYKIILIINYLYMGMDRLKNTKLSIEDIITTYNFKTDGHKGRINEQVVSMLSALKYKKIITGYLNLEKITTNQLIECKYNGIEKDENDNYINFTMVSYNIFKKILEYKDEKVDNVALLFYYCYLCSRIFTRKSNDGDVNEHGGKAEVCYPSYETISKDTNLSPRTINKYNNILVNMNLIRIGNLGLYYVGDNKKYTRESPNFYVLIKDEKYVNTENEKNMLWYINLKEGMKCFKKKHSDYTFLNTRDYKGNDRKTNGYIARITQLEKEDKATDKQIKKRDKLLIIKEDKKQNKNVDTI